MSIAYVLVGMPGSGKTAFREKLKLTSISTDDIIERHARSFGKTYSEVFHITIGNAEKEMWANLGQTVNDRLPFVVDRTNLTKKSRAKVLNRIPGYYTKIAIVFPSPDNILEILVDRAKATGKDIPMAAIKEMNDNFVYPAHDEGFDIIMEYKRS